MPPKTETGKASEKPDKPEVKKAEATEPEAPATPSEPVFSVARFLIDGEALTGVPTYILAGALHGRTGGLTVKQAKAASDKFLNAEVQQEG